MKVTVFFVINFIIASLSCNTPDLNNDQLIFQQRLDSVASKKIDSAYTAINRKCDSLAEHRLPLLVDSLIKTDTTSSLNVALLP